MTTTPTSFDITTAAGPNTGYSKSSAVALACTLATEQLHGRGSAQKTEASHVCVCVHTDPIPHHTQKEYTTAHNSQLALEQHTVHGRGSLWGRHQPWLHTATSWNSNNGGLNTRKSKSKPARRHARTGSRPLKSVVRYAISLSE